MSNELTEINIGFQGLHTLYQTYLPNVDPVLINDLLLRLQENPNTSPYYIWSKYLSSLEQILKQ